MLKAPNFIAIDNLSGHHEGEKNSITGQHWSIPMMMMMSWCEGGWTPNLIWQLHRHPIILSSQQPWMERSAYTSTSTWIGGHNRQLVVGFSRTYCFIAMAHLHPPDSS
jgi:hypothetical protein